MRTQNGKENTNIPAATRLRLIAPSASPEEAAAVVAALERFMRATSPTPRAQADQAADGWRRAAILEGVERDAGDDVSDPWINT